MSQEKLIALRFFDTICITTEEYEKLSREVSARVIAQDAGLVEWLIAKLLDDASYRYIEIKKGP